MCIVVVFPICVRVRSRARLFQGLGERPCEAMSTNQSLFAGVRDREATNRCIAANARRGPRERPCLPSQPAGRRAHWLLPTARSYDQAYDRRPGESRK